MYHSAKWMGRDEKYIVGLVATTSIKWRKLSTTKTNLHQVFFKEILILAISGHEMD
jgi:hypothetical protein